MPRLRIPTNKQYLGIFPGEFFGTIFSAKNISLERNKGKLALGESLSVLMSNVNDTDPNDTLLVTPEAFVRSDADGTDRWWLNGGRLIKTPGTDPEGTWARDTLANSPTSPIDDLAVFAGDLYCPTSTDVARLSTTWDADFWSTRTGASALQSGKTHSFGIFAGALLHTDGRFINTYDGTIALDPAITLPEHLDAEWIRAMADFAVIGTKSLSGQEAEVFLWDRSSASFNTRYPIGDRECLTGFVAHGIPYVITKKGMIKKFTGSEFATVQVFPTVELGIDIEKIHTNGTIVDEDKVLINVRFGITTSFDRREMRLLDGLWIFNVATGNLYHHISPVNQAGDDYSQQEIADVGAIALTVPTQGRYLIAAETYNIYTGTTRHTVQTSDEDSTSSHRGYFITPKIPSADVSATWKQIFIKFRRLLTSSDEIRIMYRIQEDNNLPEYETITWASTTTFTGTNANVAVNDFVEVLAGPNAGVIAKITAIASGTPNTYTIDVTVNSSTDTARARYLKFIDLGKVTSQTIQREVFRIKTQKSPWIQFMVSFIGAEDSPEVEEMLLDFKEESL